MLVILAHPDDEAFGPAGTLAMCARDGIRVTLAMATRGEAGRRLGSPPFCAPGELGSVRWEELTESCRVLGLEPPVFLGLRDKAVSAYGPDHVDTVAGLMMGLSPSAVITLGPDGGLSPHPDHQAVSRLTVDAWRSLDESRRPRLCYYQRWPDATLVKRIHGLCPGHVVVRIVDGGRRARLSALRAHRSQTEQISELWGDDDQVLAEMPRQEHFLIPDPALGGRRCEGGAHLLLCCGDRREPAAGRPL